MLDNINKKMPFQVPENYFENFNKDIMAMLPIQDTQPKKVVLWKKVMPWAAVAAMFAGVLLSVTLALKAPNEEVGQTISNSAKQALTSSSEEDELFQFLEDQSMNGLYNETLLNQ